MKLLVLLFVLSFSAFADFKTYCYEGHDLCVELTWDNVSPRYHHEGESVAITRFYKESDEKKTSIKLPSNLIPAFDGWMDMFCYERVKTASNSSICGHDPRDRRKYVEKDGKKICHTSMGHWGDLDFEIKWNEEEQIYETSGLSFMQMKAGIWKFYLPLKNIETNSYIKKATNEILLEDVSEKCANAKELLD